MKIFLTFVTFATFVCHALLHKETRVAQSSLPPCHLHALQKGAVFLDRDGVINRYTRCDWAGGLTRSRIRFVSKYLAPVNQ